MEGKPVRESVSEYSELALPNDSQRLRQRAGRQGDAPGGSGGSHGGHASRASSRW